MSERSDLYREALSGAQQARCPVHDVALDAFGLCRTNTSIGCEWNRNQSIGMMNSVPSAYSQADLRNAGIQGDSMDVRSMPSLRSELAMPPEPLVYFSDTDWERKFAVTQGIRGALRNLWRQFVK